MRKSSELIVPAESQAALSSPLRDIPMPPRLWVPCATDSPKIGELVHRGESMVSGTVEVPSPAKGIVVGISQQSLLGGTEARTLVVDTHSDENNIPAAVTDSGSVKEMLDRLAQRDVAFAIRRLTAAGVWADRWTSPDLLGQLRGVLHRPVKIILCGALDLDPALPVQRALAAASAMDLAAGAAALGKLCGAARAFLVVPEDMSAAGVASLRAAAEATGVRLFPLPNEYPQGHPSMLMRQVTGKRLRPGMSPTEVGAVVLDAPAAIAVGRCFLHGESMLRVPLGLFDQERSIAHLLSVPVGMKLTDVLTDVSIPREFCDLHASHLLRELPASRKDVVCGTELTVFAAKMHGDRDATACLRCGWCVEACPVRIHPAGLLEAAQQHDVQLADDNGIHSCIECGICTHVCPARLPLLASIRDLRHEK